MIIELIEQIHAEKGTGYRDLCEQSGLAYSSFMRWRQQSAEGEVFHRPGPKKTEPLDLDGLRKQIGAMEHGTRRSKGTGDLYHEHKDTISRRDLTEMVRDERNRQKQVKTQSQYRIQWHVPRLVWAMDDTEYRPDPQYPKAYLHNVKDLGSRYTFGALVGLHLASGSEVVAHLEELFKRYGPPLFLKRDNGGNLNHREVDELLRSFMVIPLNSPCYYPKYNGSMERTQRDIKESLDRHVKAPSAFLSIQAEMDIHELNHRSIASLNYKTPCSLFQSGEAAARYYTKPRRKEVFDNIRKNTLEFMRTEGYEADRAWRRAVRNWLLENEFITVSKGGKV